jgi:hypothetical protein
LHKSSNFTTKPLNPFAMKSPIFLLAFAALAFTSCTSAYKTGQTPDDVYYSPTRPQDEYVRTEKTEDRRYYGSDDYYEDRYLRMRVANRYRWSALDDYYSYSPYAYHYYGTSNWYSPYNNYWCWNNYYNPYYPGVVIIKNPTSYVRPSRPIAFNPGGYGSGSGNTGASRATNFKNGYNSSSSSPRYNNSNSFGNTLRKVFSGSSNNSNSGYDGGSRSGSSNTPSRSYNPSSSSSSSSSSGGRSSSSSSGGGGSSSGGSRPSR